MFELGNIHNRNQYGGDDPDTLPTPADSASLYADLQVELAARRKYAAEVAAQTDPFSDSDGANETDDTLRLTDAQREKMWKSIDLEIRAWQERHAIAAQEPDASEDDTKQMARLRPLAALWAIVRRWLE